MLRSSSAPGLILALLLVPSGCLAQHGEAETYSTCAVSRVSDGDSFRCADGRRVRLIGIDSPESQQLPFGPRSRDALLQLIPVGARVRLEPDAARTDRYRRELAYVWSGATLVNEAMLRDGWAVIYTVPPNVKYADRLARAQKEARAEGAGLWNQQGFACIPSEFRRNRCVSLP